MATIEEYRKQLNELQNQKNNITANSLSDVEKTALDSKISNTQTLINNYADNVSNLQSSKAEAYSAKQNAIANANAILGYSGYGTQGMAQTTRANMANAYANQLSQANADFNSANSNYFKTYQEQLEKIEQDKYANQATVQDENYNNLVDEIDTIISTNLNQTNIDKYKAQIEEMTASGELSQAQANALNKKLQVEGEDVNYLKSIGANTTAVNLGDYLGKWNDDGSQSTALKSLQNDTQRYIDAGLLQDGDVIDINYGKGTKLVVYKNGSFYEITNKSTKLSTKNARNAKSISDLYKELNS